MGKTFDLDNELIINLFKGSIFKATVSRVETSLDAAFVNFGMKGMDSSFKRIIE